MTEAGEAGEALARLKEFAYDALVVALRLPDGEGMSVMSAAVERYPEIVAVVATGYGGVAEAVTAIKGGAHDFLIKPYEASHLGNILRTALKRRQIKHEDAEIRALISDRHHFDHVIGQSPAMQRVFATLQLVAPTSSTVLIQGETGTGKELIARTIHLSSPRAGENFVAFNAAAIPESLAEAELFGHVKGAFTGAVAARMGRFELAHRGTLFIDEVSLMPLPLQAKLLRALQEREFQRVGESRPIKFDARLIAATNIDLHKLVKENAFREDLYYRLKVIPVTLPPLRVRVEDIPLLARHFVYQYCKENGLPPRVLTQDTIRCLMAYSWPGNIRQLENAIEHAIAMTGQEREIPKTALPEDITEPSGSLLIPSVTIPDEGINFTAVVSQLERELILRCLEKTAGNKRQAARLLNLSRTTLIDKLQRLNVADQFSLA